MFQRLKGFTRAFWTANIVELLERGAYYGVFIVITLYLSRILGFTDVEAAWISGAFSGGLYFLPTFSGALADKIGFKYSLIIAFSLLSLGYFGLEMQLNDNPLIAEHALGMKLHPTKSTLLSIAIGSPAEMCGMRIGDQIIGINQMRLNNDFEQWLAYFNLNDIKITVVRAQKIIEKKMPIVHRTFFQKYALKVLDDKSSNQSKALRSWACDGSL